MIGQVLSHYRIVEQIGSGGMGVVYRGVDERLRRDVAIKLLPQGVLQTDEARRRFRREAHALSRLSHPHISTILDFDSDAGHDFLVMEYVQGGTLAEELRRGPLPIPKAVALARQVAQALEEAHEHGIIHRDLKPGNVMVTPKGWAKVLDFGLAKFYGVPGDLPSSIEASITDDHAVAGTIPYMAPEQLLGQPVDARTDLHALGALLYEMTTGARPFTGETVGHVIDAVIRKPAPSACRLRPDLPPSIDRILSRALEKDPDRRYQSAGEMLHALEAIDSPGSAEATTVTSRPRRTARNVVLISSSGVLALGIVAVLTGGGRGLLEALHPGPRYDAIAVLPLENAAGDPAQDFFAEGMTDAITSHLAQIADLRVISRTSSAAARRMSGGTREIARRLDVDALIEGTVARSGGRVRVSAKLIDAPQDRYIWGQSFERDIGDVIALQGDMALAIAQQIRSRLSPRQEKRLATAAPVRPEAYEAYLRGRYFWNRRSREGIEAAVTRFKRAIEIDPRYAAAYAGLADAYAVSDLYTGTTPRESFPLAREAALKALQIDDQLAEAHACLGRVRLHFDRDLPGAEKEFRRAIELNPGYATAHHWYSIYLRDVGRSDDAVAEAERARSIDPLSLIVNANLGDVHFYGRRYDRAAAQLQETIQLDSTFAPAHLYLGNTLERMGRYSEALVEIERARALSGKGAFGLGPLGFVAARAGDRGRARSVLTRLEALRGGKHVMALDLALVHLGLGEPDRALNWLKIAYEERAGLNDLGVDPRFDPLRLDRRFRTLLDLVGLKADVVAHP